MNDNKDVSLQKCGNYFSIRFSIRNIALSFGSASFVYILSMLFSKELAKSILCVQTCSLDYTLTSTTNVIVKETEIK